MNWFEQALAVLPRLPDTRENLERAIDLRLDLRQSLFPLNRLAEVWTRLQEAERLSRALDDPRRLGWVSAYVSGHHLHTGGHVTEMRTFAQRIEAIAGRLGDDALHVTALYYLAGAADVSGDYRDAERVCRKLMQSLHDRTARERYGLAVFPAVIARAYLARALAERGRFEEGDAHGREAIRIGEALDHPFSIVVACIDLGYVKSRRGELTEATGLLERAVAQCREWDITNHAPIALASLGHACAWSGRLDEGISYLQQALTAYERAGIGFRHSLTVERLGEAYLRADQVDHASACADRAVALARERGERGFEAWALHLLGEIASHRTRVDATTAAAHYGAAMALASDLDMRPLAAHCHAGLGRLHRRTGADEQAQTHLTTARAMYGEMGMTTWLERLETG